MVVDERDGHAKRAAVQRHPQQVVSRVAVAVHVVKAARILVAPREGVPQGEVPPLQHQDALAGQGGYGGQQLASALAHAPGGEHLQELLQG